MRRSTIMLAAVAALALAGCNKPKDAEIDNASAAAGTSRSAAEALASTEGLGTTSRLIKQAGLERALNGVGSYTIFAPADEAFASLPEDVRKELGTEEGRPQLTALLRRHLATGYIAREDLDRGLAKDGGSVRVAVMAGPPLELRRQGEAIVIGAGENAPRIVGPAVTARNAVIYRIDRVLPPPAAQ